MLLPSAFNCDSTVRRLPRLASPPASPPQSGAFGTLLSSCLSLQNMLSAATPPSSDGEPTLFPSLPTPPMAHAPAPLFKVRVRTRKANNDAAVAANTTDNPITARKRVIRRAPLRSTNNNQRVRIAQNDNRENNTLTDDDCGTTPERKSLAVQYPSTPRRTRIAPEALPLGLERADYHALVAEGLPQERSAALTGTLVQTETDGASWSMEDDCVLLELLLERMKVAKEDWADVARTMGKDHNALMMRWKGLVARGDVGLTGRTRGGLRSRVRLHGTW